MQDIDNIISINNATHRSYIYQWRNPADLTLLFFLLFQIFFHNPADQPGDLPVLFFCLGQEPGIKINWKNNTSSELLHLFCCLPSDSSVYHLSKK